MSSYETTIVEMPPSAHPEESTLMLSAWQQDTGTEIAIKLDLQATDAPLRQGWGSVILKSQTYNIFSCKAVFR